MEMYLKFVGTLGFGLLGLGLVLKMLLEQVLADWDLFGDLARFCRAVAEGRVFRLAHKDRVEDVRLEIENIQRAQFRGTRLIDQKREQLKEIELVEHRLSLPQRAQPITITPLPPPPPPEQIARN